jgi:excisionase family DNA binding protein
MQQQVVITGSHQHFEALLTAEETAVHLRCHLKTVQKMAREGRMPSIRRGNVTFSGSANLTIGCGACKLTPSQPAA